MIRRDYILRIIEECIRGWRELGIEKHLHSWPDKSLGSQWLAD
jgi:hypothetical protein